MIIFNLECNLCGVNFEGWFEDTAEFEKQKKQKIINCPSCNSSSITKALMTPNVSKKSNSKGKKIKKTIAANISKYKKIIEKNFDYLVDKFTEEANSNILLNKIKTSLPKHLVPKKIIKQ